MERPDMHIARTSDATHERAHVKVSRTLSLLEELLTHTIRLRDLYKSARRQTADMPTSRLRLVRRARAERAMGTTIDPGPKNSP